MSTVLLVDDSPSDRALFRTILGRAGFTVVELSRGLDAVAKAREIRPHIVVLDVNLPDDDGHAVCRAIRADPVCSGLPVLMLTTRGHDDDVLAGLEAGADDYLAKDEASEIILARVRRLVQFRKMATISVLNEQLAQVGRLVAGIVHEIRAPLTVIRGNAELIALELDGDSPGHQWVEPILRSVKTLQLRLDHLMAAVRTGPSEPKPLDAVPLLRESISLFQKGTDPRRGRCRSTSRLDEDVPIVRADAGRMIQVVLNLLANAHEAILADRAEGRIVVRVLPVAEDGEVRVRVDVMDDGPGIAPGYLDRIFEPFFTTKEGGTGYGLYLASEILKEHGGRLTAENLDGGGACLSIWLPLAEPGEAVAGKLRSSGDETRFARSMKRTRTRSPRRAGWPTSTASSLLILAGIAGMILSVGFVSFDWRPIAARPDCLLRTAHDRDRDGDRPIGERSSDGPDPSGTWPAISPPSTTGRTSRGTCRARPASSN